MKIFSGIRNDLECNKLQSESVLNGLISYS